ncbi:MAG: ABC transporter permease [Myxococcaceae bacterium]
MKTVRAREILAVIRLDLSEVRRSRWLLFCTAVYLLLSVGFVFFGMRESTVVGFTGVGRTLLSLVHALLLLLPLLALTATGQVINRAREDGTLELLLTQPLRRSSYFLGVALTRFFVLLAPLLVTLLALALLGRFAFGQEVPWGFLFQALNISAALIAAFAGLGLGVSTWVRYPARAVTWILVLWALAVVLVDFGLITVMLQWRLNPQTVFLLAALNPVQAARMGLLSGTSTDLASLGPVGVYLATQVGPVGLYGLGVVWPWAFGLIFFFMASLSFRKSDIV